MAKNKETKRKKAKRIPSPFADAIEDFANDVESIHGSLYEGLMRHLVESARTKTKVLKDFVSQKTRKRKGEVFVKIENVSQFEEAMRAARHAHIALDSVPKSVFIMLVSHLDNHFKRILKMVFQNRKDLIDSTEKNISLSEIFEMDTLDEAKAYVLDREIDQILESRLKFLEWLKTKIKVELNLDDKKFSRLVELTERRNALVHSEGCVTKRYLDACKKRGIEFKSPKKIGDKFEIDQEYLTVSFAIVYWIGIIVAHLTWRKLKPDNLDEADEHLNQIIIDLLNRRYDPLAVELAEFATSFKAYSSEPSRLIFIVNLALAYKFTGKKDKAIELLSKHDWRSTKDEYELAVAVIRDDTKKAIQLMKVIGADASMRQPYREWPVFREFRKTKLFAQNYKDIYGEDYITTKNQ